MEDVKNNLLNVFFSGTMGCSEEMITIIAMLQVQNVFIRPGGGQAAISARVRHRLFEVEEGDLVTYLNVYSAYQENKTHSWCQKNFLNYKALKRCTEIRNQMTGLLRKLNIPIVSCEGATICYNDPLLVLRVAKKLSCLI